MDTTTRLITKSVTWQIGGLLTMTIIGFLFTGSIAAGGGIAVAGSITGLITYFLHEMVWSRIKWGQGGGASTIRIEPIAQQPVRNLD